MSKDNLSFKMEYTIALIKHNKGDCHHNCKKIYEELTKKGFKPQLCKGLYIKDKNTAIKHSWIEHKGLIFETDPQQLGIKFTNTLQCIIKEQSQKKKYIKEALNMGKLAKKIIKEEK